MALDQEWHKKQIELYKKEYETYKIYSKTLFNILQNLCDEIAPFAIVQTRPKEISSFAEKVVRKIDKYTDPVHQFTDLCGARIITHTQNEVERICSFIEKSFEIDRENSLDVKERLRINEFGYRSVHYIIKLPKEMLRGIEIPDEIGERKAEIQVRTILQHAWADITHDRIYKSQFKIPEKIVRESARIAATMENSDNAYLNFTNDLNAIKCNFPEYMKPNEREQELHALEAILVNEPTENKKPLIILKMVNLFKLSCEWNKIVSTIETLLESAVIKENVKSELLIELGYAYCKLGNLQNSKDHWNKGQMYLKEVYNNLMDSERNSCSNNTAIYYDSNPFITKTLSLLAWTYEEESRYDEAKELYQKAYEFEPVNQYLFAKCLSYENSETISLSLLRHTIIEGIKRCEQHILAEIELPKAYFTKGRFYYILGSYKESIKSYIEAINYCKIYGENLSMELIDNEIKFLRNWKTKVECKKEETNIIGILLLGKTVLFSEECENIELKRFKMIDHNEESYESIGDKYKKIVVMPRANIGNSENVNISTYEIIELALKDFDGYIISDNPLSYWQKILLSKRNPKEVTVIVPYISEHFMYEIKLALALGANVLILTEGGKAVSHLSQGAIISKNENLFFIPKDTMTIRAFIKTSKSPLDDEALEKAAKMIHRSYVKNTIPKLNPSAKPWEELDKTFKNSNRMQASYCVVILNSAGYNVRKAEGCIKSPPFTEQEIEMMAEIEHGRWNAERFRDGWRYHNVKDDLGKLSPWLIEWSKLPDEIKEYDRQAINNYYEILKIVGLEIYKMNE